MLKMRETSKTNSKFLPAKPVALAVSVVYHSYEQKFCAPCGPTFNPFVTEGYVGLLGSAEKVPVKILQDTGSSESFVLESILPFSSNSYTGDNVLILGICMDVMSVPPHQLFLQSDLLQGEVEVGVRPCLPVEGIQVILGNDLAGNRVWKDCSSHLVVTPSPIIHEVKNEEHSSFITTVLLSCAVTRAMSKKQEITDKCDRPKETSTLEIQRSNTSRS